MTVFGGLWVECNFQREFPADIRLRRSKRRGIGFSKKESKSTNDSFYERFVVQSESDVNVSLFMTPQMMDYIQTLDEQIRRGIYMHFLRNGKLIFALDFGHRTFGVTQMEKASVESLKQQYMEELRYVTRMIDEVMLTPALRIQR